MSNPIVICVPCAVRGAHWVAVAVGASAIAYLCRWLYWVCFVTVLRDKSSNYKSVYFKEENGLSRRREASPY